MTTVAFKDGVFMSDTGTTRGSIYDGKVNKLFKTKHWTFGFAGDSFVQNRLLEHFKNEKVSPLEKDKALTDQTLVVLAYNHKSEKLFSFNERLDSLEIQEPYYAVGTGGTFAMAALDAGADLKTAVKIAIRYDPFSYDPIREVKVKKP